MKAVLFDLDGTLVDTAADLLGTLDDVRAELGLPACTAQLPAALAARGGRGLLALAFASDQEAVERLLPRYLQLYAGRLSRLSRPYPSIGGLLDELDSRGALYAIVSNKPQALARQLLEELGWSQRFPVLVGGDTLAVRKPSPEPIWHACAALSLDPKHTVMVGDDQRDIAAGKAAGCGRTIAAAYGYLEDPEHVYSWDADDVAHSPAQLLAILADLMT